MPPQENTSWQNPSSQNANQQNNYDLEKAFKLTYLCNVDKMLMQLYTALTFVLLCLTQFRDGGRSENLGVVI